MSQLPLVTEKMTWDYANKAWHLGQGVKPILDGVTIRFATDWANCVLKAFVADYSKVIQAQVIAEIRAVAREKASGAPPTKAQGEIYVAPSAPQGGIILTD